MAGFSFPNVNGMNSVEELKNAVGKMTKELSWLLNNLDWKNINELHIPLDNGASIILDNEGITINDGVNLTFTAGIDGKVVMTGALVRSKTDYPLIKMDPEGDLFGAYTAEGKGVEIRSVGTNELADFSFVNGSDYASMSLPSSSTGLYMNGNSNLTLEFMNIYLRGYNSIQVIDWAQLKNEQTGVSMANELHNKADVSEAGYNMTFDPTSRNLKLWSKDGNLLAQVNIPA
ncbi:hypothetical protein A3844_22800 [Paenibacillus helianthi]|uniref:Uncharacterized protein n=1 Tax=Paenibacillus helianthi TaxID=1349432 RepID=A0ABX3EI42_9BACL|nr:hypothetical protein [Paenibacillus helianthi]OKP83287.1 hypothetical protein A3844_22800 [Paenibacillus helianthi]